MTPADHADTVRDGLKWHSTTKEKHSARAALDALQAQAEMLYRVNQNQIDLVRAAEAERDRVNETLLRSEAKRHTAEAERDEAERLYDECEQRYTKLEAERDGLADALQRIADGTWTPTTGDSISPREFARAALAQTEQPQPSESGRFFREPQPDSET